MGMTADQAQLMSSYPVWMTVAFAVGTFGGVIGCILLLLGNKLSKPIFALSLVGYIVLCIGDYTEGVFAALGTPQVTVLTFVVLIAAALLWLSSYLSAKKIRI